MSAAERPILPRDDPAGAPGVIAYAGVDPTLEGRVLQDALLREIATRGGSCWWDVNRAGWLVTLDSSEGQEFYGHTLEKALAWCLVWLMARAPGGSSASGHSAFDWSAAWATLQRQPESGTGDNGGCLIESRSPLPSGTNEGHHGRRTI